MEEQKAPVSEREKKVALESTLFDLSRQEPFLAGLIQELNIKYSREIPTACIYFDTKKEEFNMLLNPEYFCGLPTIENRRAILLHEILHFSHGHLFRGFMKKEGQTDFQAMKDARVDNIAADIAINQLIQHLPEGCLYPEMFKVSNTETFPRNKTFEQYRTLLQETRQKQQQPGDEDGDEEGKGGGKGDGTGEKKPGKGKGKPSPKGEEYRDENEEKLRSMEPVDIHDWLDNLSDEEKEKLLSEAKKVIKRTIEKTSTSHDRVPGGIKELLDELEATISAMNYKSILRQVIRRTICVADRQSTWKRPNKRYGVYTAGTKLGALPSIGVFADTSGSISVKELNQFLQVMDGFLKAGNKKCTLGLWHTDLYYCKPYKFGQSFDKSEVQSGGTDIGPALHKASEGKQDLAIILTDGYYDSVEVPKSNTEYLFIISPGGNLDHPMKALKNSKTIKLEGLL